MPLEELRRRRPGPLFGFLGAVAAVAALCFAFALIMPAVSGLFVPIYFLLALAAAIYLLRWARPRKGDRRQKDRRSSPD